MSVTGFNRRRRELARREAEEKERLLAEKKAKAEEEEKRLAEEKAKERQEAENGGQTIEEDQEGPEAQEELAGLEEKTVPELREEAKNQGIEGYSKMKRDELLEALRG